VIILYSYHDIPIINMTPIANSLKNKNDAFEIMRAALRLGPDAEPTPDKDADALANSLRIDLVIDGGGRRYFIEMKRRATVDAIARLALARDVTKGAARDFVMAASTIPPFEAKLAEEAGIRTLQLPFNANIPSAGKDMQRTTGKIASEKSWRIISRLLKEGDSSIRHLATCENVSYGWAHATIKNLLERGIAGKAGGHIRISDVDKLLNGAAWERHFEKLFAGEIRLGSNDPFEAAREISAALKEGGARFAFTGYTAGEAYTGYGRRHDSVYLYIEKDLIGPFLRTFDKEDKTGIRVRVYTPDRDLFEQASDKKGVVLASPAQTLLDLAGMGYVGRDMAKEMVKKYASL